MPGAAPYPLRLARLARLALHLARGLAITMTRYPRLSPPAQRGEVRRWSRQLLAILSVKLDAGNAPDFLPPRCMLVMNHVSWLDVFVINAWMPATFIAKSEVRDWPLIGALCVRTGTLFIERGRRAAAHLLEASEGDIEFEAGIFRVAGTDRQISIRDVARTSYRYGNTLPAELASGLEAVGTFSSPNQNYPNGCYVVELEVDPDTGIVELDKIVAVDDVGRVINPVLFDGQVHGSIAQGVGQALLESMEFDGEGQVLSGSFIDYAMPRADVFPDMLLTTRNVPTGTNPLGVKGGAETGTVGSPAAVIGAVLDALSPFDVRDIDMPATPQRIWRAMSRAPDSPPAVPVSSIKGGSN